ncbi:hypothetical protein QR98_0004170 [Sarcoptes scabiei]|uniref:MD-2-related lipid-recognition domain-containing protein n=1 Tax=Sarcoptes scabiei TaxID=52283 RepID=A0A131ZTA6_SARSC|nr:hypothetical protein QR98_0004170 [Sarcoptes scabiei]
MFALFRLVDWDRKIPPKPISVRFEQCLSNRTNIVPGAVFSYTTEFEPKFDVEKLFMKIYVLGLRSIRLPLFRHQNLCLRPDIIECPIRSRIPTTLNINLRLPGETPQFNGTLRIVLIDGQNNKLLCYEMPFLIEKRNKESDQF